MKATLERLFGHPIYLKLKETATITDWRNAIVKLLDAIALSVDSTVKVADQDWRDEISQLIKHGKVRIKVSETMDELFASLCATMVEIVFTQIGLLPSRTALQKTVPLKVDWWTFDRYRSVQYVQSAKQREAAEATRTRRAARHREPDA